MIGIVIIAGVVVVAATLAVGYISGGVIGTQTGAAVDDSASDDSNADSCSEAQQALEEIDRQIAELREEIEQANRIEGKWTSIGIYLRTDLETTVALESGFVV